MKFAIVFVLLLCAAFVGNILKLADCDFKVPYKCEVIHSIGIIPARIFCNCLVDTDEQD